MKTAFIGAVVGIMLGAGAESFWSTHACNAKIEEAIQLEKELDRIAPLPRQPKVKT